MGWDVQSKGWKPASQLCLSNSTSLPNPSLPPLVLGFKEMSSAIRASLSVVFGEIGKEDS